MRMATGNATLRCDYCQTVVVTQADSAGVSYLDAVPGDFKCPVCAVPLWNATLHGVKLCACMQCGGMLIAMGVFGDLVDGLRTEQTDSEIPAPPDPSDLQRRLSCPRCRGHLDMHFYLGGGGSVIGGCEQCSLNWLDGGVLMRIVRAPHHDDAQTEDW